MHIICILGLSMLIQGASLASDITVTDVLIALAGRALKIDAPAQFDALYPFKKGFSHLPSSPITSYSGYIIAGSGVAVAATAVWWWQQNTYGKGIKQVRQDVAAVHQDVAAALEGIGAVDEHLQERFLKTQELVLATQAAIEQRLEELEATLHALLSHEGELTREKIAQLYDESGKIRAQLNAISSEQKENQRALLETFTQESDLTRESIVQLQGESVQMRTQLVGISATQEENRFALQKSLDDLGLTLRTEMQQTGSAQTAALLDFEKRTGEYLKNEFSEVHAKQDAVIQLLTQQRGSHTRTLPTTCASSSIQLTQR